MLEAEKIKQNWEMYRDRVNDLFPTRKDQLNKMYDDFEDRLAMMPASSMAHFHNAFAGGYIDHVLRVMDCTETLYDVWFHQGADMSGYTKEELMFAAMHHDLAKLKTNMAIILHHGDHMAAQIEYEQWRNHKAGTPKTVSEKSKSTKSTAMKNLAENNPNIGSSIADIFKDMS